MSFAKISILKTPGEFDRPLTYRIPAALLSECRVGRGVSVELRKKTMRGIVIEVGKESAEADIKIRDIGGFIDELALDPTTIELAGNLADYYGCSMLRALKLFVPKDLWRGTGKRTLKLIEKTGYKKPDYGKFPLAPFEYELTVFQQKAVGVIQIDSRPVLLYGVTGSGKTEIYLRAILDAVRNGKQATLLVPEIALTPQMIGYFERYFGPHLALFHSKLSDGQRLIEWFKAKSGYAPLVIGSRSAIFAPVKSPGIIILDEEHEWTYKQESAPYYETHRVAEMLKERTGCRLVFGSATPKMETYYKAETGEYALAELPDRVNQSALPAVKVVDLREEFRRKNFSIFSLALHAAIRQRLKKKEQIILFVNQRGMARAVLCRDCGHALSCSRCEVSLTLHGGSYGSSQRLLCHYCSYQATLPCTCPNCQSHNIRHAGVGTERVEEELFKFFPQARVIRADKDTTSDKLGFSPIYEAFKAKRYDVLVGTQMVAKGLDFPGVTLIGIVLADIGLHIPDFRSHERLFQLITQVSGRAGRGETAGEVILQTYQPEHPAIRLAAKYSYKEFAKNELGYRRRLVYPPFGKLIKFIVTGADLEQLQKRVHLEREALEDICRVNKLSMTVIAAPAMVPKIGGSYYYHVFIKGPDARRILDFWKIPGGWRVDIDPVHCA